MVVLGGTAVMLVVLVAVLCVVEVVVLLLLAVVVLWSEVAVVVSVSEEEVGVENCGRGRLTLLAGTSVERGLALWLPPRSSCANRW